MKVCDIVQNNDDTDLFGILCRVAGEKDKFFSFKVISTSSSSNSSNLGYNANTTINTTMITSNSTNNISSSVCGNMGNTTNNNNSNNANQACFNGYSSTLSSSSSNSSNTAYSIYASSTNLNMNDENYQAQAEKKEYVKLLAQGICNVRCITEYVRVSVLFLQSYGHFYI